MGGGIGVSTARPSVAAIEGLEAGSSVPMTRFVSGVSVRARRVCRANRVCCAAIVAVWDRLPSAGGVIAMVTDDCGERIPRAAHTKAANPNMSKKITSRIDA